jgi:hypothetical protein
MRRAHCLDKPARVVCAPAPSRAVGSIERTLAMNLDKKATNQVRLQKEAPHLVELDKKVGVSLQKAGLAAHTARVALCLDISASMSGLYGSGKVQAFLERILTLALRFDEDGAVDVFSFGVNAYIEEQITLDTYRDYTGRLRGRRPLEGGTNYGKAIELLRRHYFPAPGPRTAPVADALPVYVMFVTDGQTTDESHTRKQIVEAAFEPIFWQFMGIGKSKKDVKAKGGGFFARLFASDFSFLESLDTMGGRHVDNANFFSVEDPAVLSDDQLYDLMMAEYPGWVQLARPKGLLR